MALLENPEDICQDRESINLILFSASNLTAEDPVFRNMYIRANIFGILKELLETDLDDD
jgi:hypothetical protein